MSNFLRTALLTLAALTAAPVDVHAVLDPAFAGRGVGTYGFMAVPGAGNADHAAVACPGPDGTMNVLGDASGAERVVMIRLLPNGQPDDRFGVDGKQSFDLGMSTNDRRPSPSLCQADGFMVVARYRTSDNGSNDLQIFRVSPHTGLLDPSFGGDGIVDVNLDDYVTGLGAKERPLGLHRLDDGDLVLTGWAQVGSTTVVDRPFVAQLRADGVVRGATVIDVAPAITASSAMAIDASTLLVTGEAVVDGRFVPWAARLVRGTLQLQGTHVYPGLADFNVFSSAGRTIAPGVLVVPGILDSRTGALDRAVLVVYRGTTATLLPLAITSSGLDEIWGDQGIVVVRDGGVMVYAKDRTVGVLHFGMARIGATAAGDRIEDAWARGGALRVVLPHADPECRSDLAASRLTLWSGRPFLVGDVDSDCGSAEDRDYLAVAIDYVFTSGFD